MFYLLRSRHHVVQFHWKSDRMECPDSCWGRHAFHIRYAKQLHRVNCGHLPWQVEWLSVPSTSTGTEKRSANSNFQQMNTLITRQTSQTPPWGRETRGIIHANACPDLNERNPASSPFLYSICWTQPQSSFRRDMPMAFPSERYASCDHLEEDHSSGRTHLGGFVIFLLHT